jgi:hypothetical protein
MALCDGYPFLLLVVSPSSLPVWSSFLYRVKSKRYYLWEFYLQQRYCRSFHRGAWLSVMAVMLILLLLSIAANLQIVPLQPVSKYSQWIAVVFHSTSTVQSPNSSSDLAAVQVQYGIVWCSCQHDVDMLNGGSGCGVVSVSQQASILDKQIAEQT